MTMACAANIIVRPEERLVTQVLVIAFVAACAFYARSCRRDLPVRGRHGEFARRFAGLVLLATAMGAGWASASGLHDNARGLEQLLGWAGHVSAGSATTGFSGRAHLDSVQFQKGTATDSIALTIYGDKRPGYLRGRVFDQYDDGEWHVFAGGRSLPVADAVPQVMTNTNEHETVFITLDEATFARADPQLGDGFRMEVWPDVSLAGNIFVPAGTAYFQADTRSATANGHGVLESSDLPGGFPYTLFVLNEPPAMGLWPSARAELLNVPSTLDSRILDLARKVFAGCRTVEEKIAAVEKYFSANYQYQLGITVPRGQDPLTYFLLERPSAHCEYFAAGAAILLRLAGVPSRYVTGFVAAERNDLGGCWVARNRDAHAWVEALDEKRGWVLVEATPSAGRPHVKKGRAYRNLWEQLRSRLTIFRFRLDQGGVKWLMAATGGMLSGGRGILLAALLTLGSGAIAMRLATRRGKAERIDPQIEKLHKLLKSMDVRLAKQLKLRRRSGETLHQFARRIREHSAMILSTARDRMAAEKSVSQFNDMAQWYEIYTTLRYGMTRNDATIAALKLTM
jgi:transglutaminase-like putative cysteine protease